METPSIAFTQKLSFLHIFTLHLRGYSDTSRLWLPILFVTILFGRQFLTITSLNQFISLILTVLLYGGGFVVFAALLETALRYRVDGKPIAYTFQADTFIAATPFVTFIFKWEQIAKIVESKNEFLLYGKGRAVQMILKSAIPAEQLNPLRHLLREALGDSAKVSL